MDRGLILLRSFMESTGITADCICHRCIRENHIIMPGSGMPLSQCVMVLCPKCGNKRCPHASDHRLDCTGSNEPGQAGSIYGGK